ncbi:MAG: hypothetical protein LBD71_06970 [Treponema sp.]|jgi:hypothetical protein|nr:hypothetical protein [Treponema sp.]
MKKRVLLAALLSACFFPGCTSEAGSIIRGGVRIYGSDPGTYAGIASEDGRIFAVYPPEKETEIRQLQGYYVEFTVRFLPDPKGYGSLFLKDGTVTPLSWKIID